MTKQKYFYFSPPMELAILGGTKATTLAKLGITSSTCTLRDIVNAVPYGCNVVLSITKSVVTDAMDGELYVFAASQSSVTPHKSFVLLKGGSMSVDADSLSYFFCTACIPCDSSKPTKLYRIGLTEMQ